MKNWFQSIRINRVENENQRNKKKSFLQMISCFSWTKRKRNTNCFYRKSQSCTATSSKCFMLKYNFLLKLKSTDLLYNNAILLRKK